MKHIDTSSEPGNPAIVVRSIGPRLKHIYDWGLNAGSYTDIWDLCCDHGRLGLQLHQAAALASANIHLIDCVPSIIHTLKSRYEALIDERLSIKCMDAAKVQLPSSGRHLVIIAGVGGQTVAAIMQGITQYVANQIPQYDASRSSQSEGFSLEYMLSPNLDTFELRQFLRANNFELLGEEFVSEKGRHHEHMHLRYHGSAGEYTKSTAAGQKLWQPLTEEKQRYIQKYIEHYTKRLKLCGDTSAAPVVKAYTSILKNIPSEGR